MITSKGNEYCSDPDLSIISCIPEWKQCTESNIKANYSYIYHIERVKGKKRISTQANRRE